MTQLLRLEGHLRDAGGQDGYELYLDDQALTDLLNAAMPEAARDQTVRAPTWWPMHEGAHSWTVILDEDAQLRRNLAGEGPYVPMITLGADYGRVRITIERLDV